VYVYTHTQTHTYRQTYVHMYIHLHAQTLVEPFHVITVQRRYGSDVKQAKPHTMTVCHHEHGLQ